MVWPVCMAALGFAVLMGEQLVYHTGELVCHAGELVCHAGELVYHAG